MKQLFISDLHLAPERPDIQACFDAFINTCLSNNKTIHSLYILGDLFEYWIGDDASIPLYKQSISQLKQLSNSSIPVYIMHGNRDFLLGAEFEKASGCQLIPDLYHLQNSSQENGQGILLSHGDILCSDDVGYMNFREMVRAPVWQMDFLSKSIDERLNIAQTMRKQSMKLGKQKSAEITDVNQKMVEEIMSAHGVSTLIHGHTHRPAIHEFKLKQQSVRRIVLPDWQPDAKIFEIDC